MNRAGLLMVAWMAGACDLVDTKPAPVCDPLGPQPVLKFVGSKNATSCLQPDGEVTVEAIGGHPPYRFSLDKNVQSSGRFTNLFAGDYKVKLADATQCETFVNVQVGAGDNVFMASARVTPDDKCFSDNGSIVIEAKNGTRPYRYQLEGGEERPDSAFFLLKDGFYRVKVTDAEGCKTFVGAKVEHGFTGISYTKSVQPIINARCATAGCHNGDAGYQINWLIFLNVKNYGPIIKSMVNLRKPHRDQPPLQEQEIQYINCWVDDGTRKN